MSEGAAAVAESHSSLLKEAKFTLLESEEGAPSTPPASRRTNNNEEHPQQEESEEEDDFVVYSDNATLKEVEDVSQRFESLTTESLEKSEKDEIRLERHEIRLGDGSDDGETQPESESMKLADVVPLREPPSRIFLQEDAINSFQDVPLLQGNPDGLFFNGLVFCDTVDSLYRPVVVINTRAIPHKSLRAAALKHLREALEPVVSTGPYVLIFTSFAASSLSKLPVSWVLAAYRELSYPFKKNVQHVILVRPNKFLKAFVRVMKLVVKKQAHSKIKQILYLGDIENVTNGEVALEHLSPKVIQALGNEELNYSDVSAMTQ